VNRLKTNHIDTPAELSENESEVSARRNKKIRNRVLNISPLRFPDV
jgi:hypothetical protein